MDGNTTPPDGQKTPETTTAMKRPSILDELSKRKTVLLGVIAIIGVSAFVVGSSNQDTLGDIELGADFEAEAEQVFSVDVAEENGFSYALGAPATDETDYDAYALPAVDPALEAEFIQVVNTSEVFADITHIYELLEYDDFDNDGNIKEEVMREIIEIGQEAQ